MPSAAKTLNAANLEALGASRLAALIIEVTKGDAAARRQLRLALAGNAGPAQAAREVGKRIATLAKSRRFVERHEMRPLAAELETQRRAIVDLVAPGDPREAYELVWRLVACAQPVYARSDDSDGTLGGVFETAVRDLGALVQAAGADPLDLAARAFEALREDGYGVCDDMVAQLAPRLGKAGLGRLKALVEAWRDETVAKPPERERQVIGWSSVSGRIYADDMQASHRKHAASAVLKDVAQAQGDVNAFIAQFDARARTMPGPATDIARRLLEAGRPEQALKALDAVAGKQRDYPPQEWEQARIDTFDALGRADDAQAFRWERFEATLNPGHLREYVSRLPDFEDFDAEQRALEHAAGFKEPHHALAFLVTWPDLARANRLVLARTSGLDGRIYEVLSPAADALAEKHPLASTVLRRAMIDYALGAASSSRYKHAARHLRQCAGMADRIDDFGGRPDHAAYERALRAAHGRKSAFWQEVTAIK